MGGSQQWLLLVVISLWSRCDASEDLGDWLAGSTHAVDRTCLSSYQI